MLPKSMELAAVIAGKSLAGAESEQALHQRHRDHVLERRLQADPGSTAPKLTVTADAKEGIRAFLEKREPTYGDN